MIRSLEKQPRVKNVYCLEKKKIIFETWKE